MKTRSIALRLPFVLGAIAAIVSASGRASAQTGDPALARQLFAEGRKLAAQGQYEKACPKFEESARQSSGVGTLFNLGDCWEHLGRTATAWARFLDAAALASRAGQTDREKAARTRAAQLEPKLSRLTIEVRGNPRDLSLSRNGVAMNEATWGTAHPIDPGTYEFEAKAPGRQTWKLTETVSAGAKVVVTVPDLAPSPVATTAPPTAVAPANTPATVVRPQDEPASPTAQSNPGSAQRVVAIVAASAGVAVLAGSAVYLVKAKSTNDRSHQPGNCAQNDCSDDGLKVRNDAISQARIATILFGVGTAALVGGAVLWFTAPKAESVTVGLGLGPQQIAVRGTW